MLIIKDLNVDDLISSADIAEASRHFFALNSTAFFCVCDRRQPALRHPLETQYLFS